MTYKVLRVCATAFLMAASLCPAAGQEKPAAQTAQTAQNDPPDGSPVIYIARQLFIAQRYPR